ncbi:MAG TPA: amino acid ABC transporter substrate-binding protein, partial [Treponemataceae bacterium]|nr:amino acid ABC transporter substrate-binding protein [Treponemataceae bacterium]
MKKMLMTMLFVCAAALVLAGGRREEEGDRSLEKITEKGVFVLGLDDSFPPMGFRDEDNTIV